MNQKKECVYKVDGMHCPSCEILIEKKILNMQGIKAVEASTAKGEVVIEYEGAEPKTEQLNNIFSKDKYSFSRKEKGDAYVINLDGIIKTVFVVAAAVAGYIILNRLGLGKYANVSSSSSLPAFFVMGLIAGVSSCAALVGGIVLSMSKQWNELYAAGDSTKNKLQPHIIFNIGRLASYAVFGAILGGLGMKLQVSSGFSSYLIIFVSIVMILLALQMLGVRALRRFQFTMPKFITRRIADEKNFQGRYMPMAMGAATFFLPCGFTITAQGIALLSGSAVQGALIMFLFALGTAPTLLLIGASSVKFSSRPHLAAKFSKIAGLAVLFFALFNLNAQAAVLGFSGFGSLIEKNGSAAANQGLPQIVGGKQIIKMTASSRGYSPNYIKVRLGVPVRWEITDTGTSGCTNAIVSRLFEGQINLRPGQVSVKEFTPDRAGKFRFSCWMGMVSGVIEVIDPSVAAVTGVNTAAAAELIPSGAAGCGGGAGGGCGCGN